MKWFEALPWQWQIALTIISIIAVVLISIYGKFVFQKDKTKIGIGDVNNPIQDSPQNTGPQKLITSPKRSCGDCYMLIRQRIITAERKIKALENLKIAKPMNFLEQCIATLQATIVDAYTELMNKHRTQTQIGEETKQFRLYEAQLADAFSRVKNELRRALRENGFDVLTPAEYSTYVKNEARTVTTLIYTHLRNVYPPKGSGMIVEIDAVLSSLEEHLQSIESYMFDFFNFSRDNTKQVVSEINKLDDECDNMCSNLLGIPVQMPAAV